MDAVGKREPPSCRGWSLSHVPQHQKIRGAGRLWFWDSILRKHSCSWLSLPGGGVVPCPWGPPGPPAVPWLWCLVSDPITYSSLGFSCLSLIILTLLYLLTSRPEMKLPGGSPAALQGYHWPPIYIPGGAGQQRGEEESGGDQTGGRM